MSRVKGDAAARKAQPIARGCLDYFPDALLAVAELSRVGNEQHNPGQPIHWAKEKSTDEADALLRHLIDRGTLDTDGIRHSVKVAWRALALLQREIDAERAPVHDTTLTITTANIVRCPRCGVFVREIPAGSGFTEMHVCESLAQLPQECSICKRPECGSVEPACTGQVWPSS